MKHILVVVDIQKDFVDGSLGFEKAVVLDDLIYNKIGTELYLNDIFHILTYLYSLMNCI